MRVGPSARRHGIEPADAVHAAEHPQLVSWLDDDSPARQPRLGFDRVGRLLEIVLLQFDDGDQLVIHAMPARRHLVDLL